MLTKRPKKAKDSRTFYFTKLIQFGVIAYVVISAVINTSAFAAKAEESKSLRDFAYNWNIATAVLTSIGTYVTGEKIKRERRSTGDLLEQGKQTYEETMKTAKTVVSLTHEEYHRMQQVEPYISGSMDATVTLAKLNRRLKSRHPDGSAGTQPPVLKL